MCLECAYSQLRGQVLKSLQRLKLADGDLSIGESYPDVSVADMILTVT